MKNKTFLTTAKAEGEQRGMLGDVVELVLANPLNHTAPSGESYYYLLWKKAQDYCEQDTMVFLMLCRLECWEM